MADPEIDYTLSVAALCAALEKLQPDDRVTVTKTANLKVIANDGQYLGYIELRDWGNEEDALHLNDEING